MSDALRDDDLPHAIEALLFAAGKPMRLEEIEAVFERLWAHAEDPVREEKLAGIKPALEALFNVWKTQTTVGGFTLCEVAEGYTFRSMSYYAPLLRALVENPKAARLSKPALETLAIVAYKQPATKPDIDFIRGVDSGGTLKVLLERDLVRVIGKKEDVGHPLLYGTTREFLNFFNLAQLSDLPSLRDFNELNVESQEEFTEEFGSMPSLQEMSDSAKHLRLDDEPAVAELDDAMRQLVMTEVSTRDSLAAEGMQLLLEPETEAALSETTKKDDTLHTL